MRRTFRTLNDCEMQHNAKVGLFTRPSIFIEILRKILPYVNSPLVVNFVHFVAKLFSFRHKGTNTLRKNSKNPGPEGPALIIPRGDLVCRQLTIYGVLEYWSDGVLEETPFFIALRKQIPGENLKV
jgi:hypothetical protein